MSASSTGKYEWWKMDYLFADECVGSVWHSVEVPQPPTSFLCPPPNSPCAG